MKGSAARALHRARPRRTLRRSGRPSAETIFISALGQLNKSYDGQKAGLPPLRATTLDPAFLAIPPTLQEAQIFALTTHQHRLGTHAEILRATDVAGPAASLYVNTDWEHPILKHYAPPLTFAPGEGLRFTCAYDNTTDRYVKFGDSALTDEMCIIWAYYYPSRGFRVYTL